MSLTIFTVPKPFVGHIGLIQRNAMASWTRLGADVLVFGQEEGLEGAARELAVRHEPGIARNATGTPLVSDAFARARALARSDHVAYVNTDIVLLSDFVEAVSALAAGPFPSWVMVGQRRDLDIREPLSFDGDWERRLGSDVEKHGSLHGKSGIDFFAFPRTLPIELPPMAVGRVGWDSWLIYATRRAGIPLVDSTRVVRAIHQNHPPAYDPAGPEADENRQSAGGYLRMGSIRDANWQLDRDAGGRLAVKPRLPGAFWFSLPVRAGLAVRRSVSRRFFGSRI